MHQQSFYLADYSPLSLRDYTNGLAKEMNAPRISTLHLGFVKPLAFMGDILNRLGWRSFPFNSFRLRNILTAYQFDLSATSRVCGDLPYCFEDGIKATANWFMNKSNAK